MAKTKKTQTARTEALTQRQKENPFGTATPTSKVDTLIAEATELCRELLVWAKRQNSLTVNGKTVIQPVGVLSDSHLIEKTDKTEKTETGITEEESLKKMIVTVTAYLQTHQKADVQKLLASKFGVEKTSQLTHAQRVELVGLLSEKNGTKEKVWA